MSRGSWRAPHRPAAPRRLRRGWGAPRRRRSRAPSPATGRGPAGCRPRRRRRRRDVEGAGRGVARWAPRPARRPRGGVLRVEEPVGGAALGIGVDEGRVPGRGGQRREVHGGRRLAHAALQCGHDDDHEVSTVAESSEAAVTGVDALPERTKRRTATLALAWLATLGAACSGDDGAAPSPSTTSVAPAPAPTDWPTAGVDLANSRAVHRRASSDARRSRTSHEVWRTELEIARIAEHRAARGRRHRLRAGRLRRRWRPSTPPPARAVAVRGDRLQHRSVRRGRRRRPGLRPRRLGRRAGPRPRHRASEVWATDVTATDTTGIDIQPVVAGELVLVELGAGEPRRDLRGR